MGGSWGPKAEAGRWKGPAPTQATCGGSLDQDTTAGKSESQYGFKVELTVLADTPTMAGEKRKGCQEHRASAMGKSRLGQEGQGA